MIAGRRLAAQTAGVIQDYKPSEVPTYQIITKEMLACIAWGALYPFGIKKSEKRTPRRKTQHTVVFMHGYMANRASFFPLHAYLRSVGVKQILSFNYQSRSGIEGAAKDLREFLRKNVRGGKIDLVCHSLGGLIAQFYIQELGGHRRIAKCISLGSPFQGTYNSYWVATRVGRELRPDSPILAKLIASKEKSAAVEFTSIVGENDNIVIPRVFAGGGKDTVHIKNVGHVGLLFSPSVFLEVARRLVP